MILEHFVLKYNIKDLDGLLKLNFSYFPIANYYYTK